MWLNAVRVQTREFIAFTNTARRLASPKYESVTDKSGLLVVEVDFSKPQPCEDLRFFGSQREESSPRKSWTVSGKYHP